jgi:hypothetical protein
VGCSMPKEVPEFLYAVFAAGHFCGELGERAIESGTISAVMATLPQLPTPGE